MTGPAIHVQVESTEKLLEGGELFEFLPVADDPECSQAAILDQYVRQRSCKSRVERYLQPLVEHRVDGIARCILPDRHDQLEHLGDIEDAQPQTTDVALVTPVRELDR